MKRINQKYILILITIFIFLELFFVFRYVRGEIEIYNTNEGSVYSLNTEGTIIQNINLSGIRKIKINCLPIYKDGVNNKFQIICSDGNISYSKTIMLSDMKNDIWTNIEISDSKLSHMDNVEIKIKNLSLDVNNDMDLCQYHRHKKFNYFTTRQYYVQPVVLNN